MYFHESLADMLVKRQANVMFGLVGDANLFLVRSYCGQPGTTYVPLLNEADVVSAAAGYAEVSNHLGVATVTHGPGLTNVITAAIEAKKAKRPILLIAGDTARRDRDHLQNVLQGELVRAAGIAFESVRAPETLETDLESAMRTAILTKQPVVLNVPIDFTWHEVERAMSSSPAIVVPVSAPDKGSVASAARLVAGARRLVVLAGKGACTTAARDALIRLAAKTGAALTTTLKARDLFAGCPANIGVFGTFSDEVARETIDSSDCIITFGASLNEWTTAKGALVANKQVIQVDTNPNAFGRYVTPDVSVLGSADGVARAIVEWLAEAGAEPSTFANVVAQRLEESDDGASTSGEPDGADTGGSIDIVEALAVVDEMFSADRVLVFDSGRFVGAAFRVLHTRQPGGFVHTASFGAIGLGLGTAIGAAVAAEGRPILLTCGDGGFLLGGVSEMATVAEQKLPITVILLNDGAYGAEHIQLVRRNLAPDLSVLPAVPFTKLAEAFGWNAYAPGDVSELRLALREIAGQDGPTLIEIKVDPFAIA